MISVLYKKGLLSINHLWFMTDVANDAVPISTTKSIRSLPKAWIYLVHGVKEDSSVLDLWERECMIVLQKSKQCTILNDLTISEALLWGQIKKNYRYEIKRGEKEGCYRRLYTSKEIAGNPTIISEFKIAYNRMFQAKGMKESFNEKLFLRYAQEDALFVTTAATKKDALPEVLHAYISDGKQARFWYSSSSFRDVPDEAERIGRLNKALHWFDFVELKRRGIEQYDWGGINFEKESTKGISEFKSRFGGQQNSYENIIMTRSSTLAFIWKVFRKKP